MVCHVLKHTTPKIIFFSRIWPNFHRKNFWSTSMHTVAETLLQIRGERLSSKDPADVLRTRIWLETIFREHRLSRRDVMKLLFNKGGFQSGIVLKWLKGHPSVKPRNVIKLAGVLPGSDFVYHLPLFDLLRNKPMKKSQLDQLIKVYCTPSGPLQFWQFPQPESGGSNKFPIPPGFLFDSNALFERGDYYGLMGILYLVRKAEAENKPDEHLDYLKDAYRALPGACRHHYFRTRWRELYRCVFAIHSRVPTSLMLLRPKLSIIESQVTARTHITQRASRPRHPLTCRFSELELPYEQAGFYR